MSADIPTHPPRRELQAFLLATACANLHVSQAETARLVRELVAERVALAERRVRYEAQQEAVSHG